MDGAVVRERETGTIVHTPRVPSFKVPVKVQDVIKNVMTQLGCPTCHSGRDLRFNIARDFVVDPESQVQQAVSTSAIH